MTKHFFGTDGIRGLTNSPIMSAELAMRVGQAAGARFLRGPHKHQVVIGKDTRLSGYMIESALVAGFTSVGMDVVMVGPVPTPAVAMLTRSMRADLGVMISASHNGFQDNGIKLFGPDGYTNFRTLTRPRSNCSSARHQRSPNRAKLAARARSRMHAAATSTRPSPPSRTISGSMA
jgi:phosphomannomutase